MNRILSEQLKKIAGNTPGIHLVVEVRVISAEGGVAKLEVFFKSNHTKNPNEFLGSVEIPSGEVLYVTKSYD